MNFAFSIWLVERTFSVGLFNRGDWRENTKSRRKAAGAMLYLSMIRILVRRLA
ncbi:MAG: hypothetical protein M3525_09800 [Acidobacteriota bacterium]|nr:hypothetical protein [Acidobacteriota bacterium]